jgi:hypothetical protein
MLLVADDRGERNGSAGGSSALEGDSVAESSEDASPKEVDRTRRGMEGVLL